VLRTATIKKCREADLDERPADEQQWCLYSKSDKLLGRHSTKESAQKQERKIQIEKHSTVRKCKPSEKDPDHEELAKWQQIWCVVDSDNNLKGRHRSKDDASKQESAIRMNAFTIRFWDGDTYTSGDLQEALAFVVEEFPHADISNPQSRNGTTQWTAKEDLRIVARIRVASNVVVYDKPSKRVILFGGEKTSSEVELASLDDAGDIIIDLASVVLSLYDERQTNTIERFGSLVKDLVDIHTILGVKNESST